MLFSDGTAVGGKDLGPKVDYASQKGILEFGHAETSKTISIDISKEAKVSAYTDRSEVKMTYSACI